jgi:hypothetical protein
MALVFARVSVCFSVLSPKILIRLDPFKGIVLIFSLSPFVSPLVHYIYHNYAAELPGHYWIVPGSVDRTVDWSPWVQVPLIPSRTANYELELNHTRVIDVHSLRLEVSYTRAPDLLLTNTAF